MNHALLSTVKDQLIRHEGLRLKPYRCTAGKLTIGIGRNLEDSGISPQEAYAMLDNDILACESLLKARIPEIYDPLDDARKSVLINMCFNLGISGLLGFTNTLALIKAANYERAANAMLVSRWAKQVGRRALELSQIMRLGTSPSTIK